MRGNPVTFDPDKRYTRRQIAALLTDQGFPTTVSALQTKASRGGGPPYERYGKWTLYRGGKALAWAKARCVAVGGSTSERDPTPINP
jgi:hypothetical protein